MYKLVYSRDAVKNLRKLPRNLAERIRSKLNQIAADPYSQHNKVTKLQNRPGFRLRVGDWRIIYYVEEEKLLFSRAADCF